MKRLRYAFVDAFVFLNRLLKRIKQHCGTGGSLKDCMVIIQGDHRNTVKGLFDGQGYTVKLAGG